ncbi:MAG: rod shape-determining protein MreD [Armatimonadetes bacterium]|nr:MAG: rod shape-determining protein MreD [Armatimonadota bacterium]
MSRARVAIALLAIIASLVIQTTVFGASGIEPLGVAPAFVTLVVIAIGPYVETEYHLLLGFTAGMLADLMGSGTLGLWAMTLTIVAYASARVRARFNEGIVLSGVLIFSLTLLGQVVFVVIGTLFGQNLLSDDSLAAKIILPAVWNLVLAVPVLWGLSELFKRRERGWAT